MPIHNGKKNSACGGLENLNARWYPSGKSGATPPSLQTGKSFLRGTCTDSYTPTGLLLAPERGVILLIRAGFLNRGVVMAINRILYRANLSGQTVRKTLFDIFIWGYTNKSSALIGWANPSRGVKENRHRVEFWFALLVLVCTSYSYGHQSRGIYPATDFFQFGARDPHRMAASQPVRQKEGAFLLSESPDVGYFGYE